MYRIERAQFGRLEGTGVRQDSVADADEFDPPENIQAPEYGGRAGGQQRSCDLGPGQRGRHQGCSATQVAAQCSGLRLGDGQLHNRGRVEVDGALSVHLVGVARGWRKVAADPPWEESALEALPWQPLPGSRLRMPA